MRADRHPGSRAARLMAAGAVIVTLITITAEAHAQPAACSKGSAATVMVSPRRPVAGQPVWLWAVSEQATTGTLTVTGSDGATVTLEASKAWGGPPSAVAARWAQASTGRFQAAVLAAGSPPGSPAVACASFTVGARAPAKEARPAQGMWPIQRSWNRTTENLYSAWIGHLFDAPPNERPGWKPLHQLFRDPQRNLLFNHLGLGEDAPDGKGAVVAKPDCADMPYFLRAYFAWKLRLPYAYSRCSRGRAKNPPRCGEWRFAMSTQAPSDLGEVAAMSWYLRREVSSVHSGNGRTLPDDDKTDFYPLALSRQAMRPGATFADPYGHLLVVSKWVDGTPARSGLLFAVDGHPDLSVGRKRFWRGAFLFHTDLSSGAGGFKGFRPVVKGKDGEWKVLSNREIAARRDYANVSREQYEHGTDGWYERVERVINPELLPPERVLLDRLEALHELVQERVDSVREGEDFAKKRGGLTGGAPVIPMPTGPSVFETTGPWEDYSTPSRDLRLLIAIHEIENLPAKAVKRPELFSTTRLAVREPLQVALQGVLERFIAEKGITYVRSDGSPWKLTLAEVMKRKRGLEVAYNPNDCVETRWGAIESTPERATCQRRAPDHQRKLMDQYRVWFSSRTRPPR
jgi:hypothetical protein